MTVAAGETEKAGPAEGNAQEEKVQVKEENKTAQTDSELSPIDSATSVTEWANEIEMQRILDDMVMMNGSSGIGLDSLGLNMSMDNLGMDMDIGVVDMGLGMGIDLGFGMDIGLGMDMGSGQPGVASTTGGAAQWDGASVGVF